MVYAAYTRLFETLVLLTNVVHTATGVKVGMHTAMSPTKADNKHAVHVDRETTTESPNATGYDSSFRRACQTAADCQPNDFAQEFRRDCGPRRWEALPTAPSIFGVYHVGVVGNWNNVLEEQLKTLSECGLLERTKKLLIKTAAGDKRNASVDVQPVVDKLLDSRLRSKATVLDAPMRESDMEAHETSSVLTARATCKEHPNAFVYYLHNKGASKYHEGWDTPEEMNRPWSYAHSLYWRKYMEYFLFEHPGWCIERLLHGAKTCGVDWKGDHYSGNFWWARCDHLLTLPDSVILGYTSAEMWIGSGWFQDGQSRHMCELATPNSCIHDAGMNLYENIVYRDTYAV